MKTKRKYWIPFVFLMVILTGVALTFVIGFLGFFLFGGENYPRDTKMFDTFYENEEMLLETDGVKWVGSNVRIAAPLESQCMQKTFLIFKKYLMRDGVKVFIKQW